jgi:hypothetical protein
MTANDEDMGLQTLLQIMSEVAPDLDETLLRECYAIQRKYQFSPDPSRASAAMERLIDEAVKKMTPEASA